MYACSSQPSLEVINLIASVGCFARAVPGKKIAYYYRLDYYYTNLPAGLFQVKSKSLQLFKHLNIQISPQTFAFLILVESASFGFKKKGRILLSIIRQYSGTYKKFHLILYKSSEIELIRPYIPQTTSWSMVMIE